MQIHEIDTDEILRWLDLNSSDNINVSNWNDLNINDDIASNIGAYNIDADIKFLSTTLKSYKFPEDKFTNKLPANKMDIDPYIDQAIEKITNKDNMLVLTRESKSISFSRRNADRIKSILKKILPIEVLEDLNIDLNTLSIETPLIRKVSVDTEIDQIRNHGHRAFRVYELYVYDSYDKKELLVVFLLDLYHLVIPRNRDLVELKEYKEHESCSSNIFEHYKSKFENLHDKFIEINS